MAVMMVMVVPAMGMAGSRFGGGAYLWCCGMEVAGGDGDKGDNICGCDSRD